MGYQTPDSKEFWISGCIRQAIYTWAHERLLLSFCSQNLLGALLNCINLLLDLTSIKPKASCSIITTMIMRRCIERISGWNPCQPSGLQPVAGCSKPIEADHHVVSTHQKLKMASPPSPRPLQQIKNYHQAFCNIRNCEKSKLLETKETPFDHMHWLVSRLCLARYDFEKECDSKVMILRLDSEKKYDFEKEYDSETEYNSEVRLWFWAGLWFWILDTGMILERTSLLPPSLWNQHLRADSTE